MIRAALCALAVLLVLAPAALGDALGDYTKVRKDFQDNGQITPCKFDKSELTNAAKVAASSPDLSYTGLPGAIDRELARVSAGACSGRGSLVKAVRIVSASPSGGGKVVLRNTGTKAVSLAGASLRDRAGKKVRLPSAKLGKRGRSAVSLGCLKGKRGKKGSRKLYACAKGAFLAKSDIVRLVDKRGKVGSQYGYGKFRRTARF
jgi:hypothetical protein